MLVATHVPDTPALFLQVTGSSFVQHWMSVEPGQCPASDLPPEPEQDEVEIHVPETPALFLHVVGVGSLAALVVFVLVVATLLASPSLDFDVQHCMSFVPGQKPGSDLPPCPAQDEVDIQVPAIPAPFLQEGGVPEVPEPPVGLGLSPVFAVGLSPAFAVAVGFAEVFLAPSVSFGPTPIHMLGRGSSIPYNGNDLVRNNLGKNERRRRMWVKLIKWRRTAILTSRNGLSSFLTFEASAVSSAPYLGVNPIPNSCFSLSLGQAPPSEAMSSRSPLI